MWSAEDIPSRSWHSDYEVSGCLSTRYLLLFSIFHQLPRPLWFSIHLIFPVCILDFDATTKHRIKATRMRDARVSKRPSYISESGVEKAIDCEDYKTKISTHVGRNIYVHWQR